MRNASRLRAALLASVLVYSLGAPPAYANTRSEAGWGLGSALASVVYVPVKVAYATAGAVFGGIAWGLSGGNRDIMGAVVNPAVRGDYVVTPAHLRGERRLEFVARNPGPGQPEQTALDLEDPAYYGDGPSVPYDDVYYAE